MELQHHFTVPVPVDEAWSVLLDLERIAPCMPGAKLTKAEGKDFAGSVKVKLGPISLLYKGTGSFTEIDTDAKRVVVDASGKDSRGNGTAAASVTAVLVSEGSGTKVTVDTDLKITGKPAQFGRGLISEVGGKLLTQFADCLAEQLAGGEKPGGEKPGGEQPAATSEIGAQTTDTDGVPAAPAPSSAESSNGQQAADTGPATAQRNGAVSGAQDRQVEAIDLLGTAGTPLLKRVMPIVAALALGAIAFSVLRRLRRARSRNR